MSVDKPINLNVARKARLQAEKRALATQNTLKHGQTKAERLLNAARSDKARAMLDAHQRDEHE